MMSDPGSDFRLYHSNSLDVLAALLARNVREPVPGQPLLAPEVVLIPQVAMRRWLQATLAAEYGVAANLEFLTPGEFVARALTPMCRANATTWTRRACTGSCTRHCATRRCWRSHRCARCSPILPAATPEAVGTGR